ncbi:T9SS type A sorting domain-containing protein [Lewinella sp. JB7]|uniref:T9SS type A sorting domain-containing protein n=1 Tax=Lewinella sp. JB7 TaxID=2962887 RepID=UPI0020C9A585|nr:T9SS type A sorting domain-containing protein [Lewinella sp. JB7]MCP9237317.1 T9SS type A sorting domain-containing protein [Lewinella sp. JB7]
MKLRFTTILAALFASAAISAQETVIVTDADLQGGTTNNWTADKEYLLDGLVYLEEGGRLNIAAGTVIRGRSQGNISNGDNTAALIIARGASIYAEGTATAPIIFTAEDDDLSDLLDFDNRDRGEWGGLIILGKATIARPGGEDGIEGIDSGEERARFGGSEDDDNSGILKYVSIRHGGAQLSTDNEINGLTLGGVGSGTTVDYIEVFANEDDGIEWFGGTVKVTHASVAFCGDDGFDYDYGWRGGGQFWFALQGPSDATGRSGEHDGASPDEQTPFSRPTIYNATYIGIGSNAQAPGGDANRALPLSVLFRDNAGGYYRNSIFTDFNGAAIAIEDRTDTEVDSYGRFQAGDLGFFNNYFFAFGRGTEATDLFLAVDQNEAVVEASTAAVAANFLQNGNVIADPELNGIGDRDADGANVDARVYAYGAAATGAPAAEAGFETVAYYGAFAPGFDLTSPSWINGWTALSQYMLTNDIINGVGQVEANGFMLDAPVPNPASLQARINFELPRAANVSLTLIDLTGRPLYRTTRRYDAGVQSEYIDATGLPNGSYLLILDADGHRLLQKMVVAH